MVFMIAQVQGSLGLCLRTLTHKHFNPPLGKEEVDTDYYLFPSLNLIPERYSLVKAI